MQLVAAQHEANAGIQQFGTTPVQALIEAALQTVPAVPNQNAFTTNLALSFHNTADGWRPNELPFTAIQPPGRGRRRAIDYHHVPSNWAVELELANQTTYSHDLLKLETAFRSGLIAAGVVLTMTARARAQVRWTIANNNSYLTYETAAIWLEIFRPALTVPLVLLGIDP